MRPRTGTRSLLVDRATLREALERKRGVERMRRVVRDRVRVKPARRGRRLEAAIAPAATHVQAVDREFADDRASVHRHVADAAPRSHHPQAPEARKERETRGDDDRKSTRLNSSHVRISYAVYCLKKKTK